jgi:protein-tyrosine phosphatase
MIDIHCHLLPEVDDGPKSWEVSEEMCRIATADGIEHIVATPHANHRYAYDRAELSARLEALQQRIGHRPKLSLGCDFHLSYENIQDALVHPDRYVIGVSRYLLVELSNYSIPPQIGDAYAKFIAMGITPIITHPERNPILQSTPGKVLEWIELGCAVQVTASAVTGAWGEAVQQSAEWLLERGAVHFIASDGHDTKHRPPVMSSARDGIAELCSREVSDALVDGNPRAVVLGQTLPYLPQPAGKK